MKQIVRILTRPTAGVIFLVVPVIMGLFVRSGILAHGDTEVLSEFIEHRDAARTTFMKGVTYAFDPMSAVILAAIAAVVVWLALKTWRAATYILTSVAASAAVTQGLKHVFDRSRPNQLFQIVSEADFSFPSGHSTAASALFGSVAIVLCSVVRRWMTRVVIAALCVAAAFLIATSRLYLGVHWATDVIAGLLVGFGTVLLLRPMLRPIRRLAR